jgi:hypothetical protein
MKLKKIAKLQIARETLRNLDEASLAAAGGGTFGSMTSGTVHGGACCAGCGCIQSQGCGTGVSCLCPTVNG